MCKAGSSRLGFGSFRSSGGALLGFLLDTPGVMAYFQGGRGAPRSCAPPLLADSSLRDSGAGGDIVTVLITANLNYLLACLST